MIRIQRPASPAILQSTGLEEERRICEGHDAGERGFQFKSTIYRHQEVISALIACHRSKCCYCEERVDRKTDVEHFRPKGQYYWLAYRWENLLLICKMCNQSKREHFPLADEASRATTHHGDCSLESPVLLDPTIDEPEEHIGWDLEMAISRGPRGTSSIDVIDLNRAELMLKRAELLATVDILLKLASMLNSTGQAIAWQHLSKKRSESSPFSAMVRAYLATATPSAPPASSPTE